MVVHTDDRGVLAICVRESLAWRPTNETDRLLRYHFPGNLPNVTFDEPRMPVITPIGRADTGIKLIGDCYAETRLLKPYIHSTCAREQGD